MEPNMEPNRMTRVAIFLAVLAFLILPVSAADPYADFIATSVNGSVPLTVSFWDLSYNDTTSYLWNATDIITTNIPTTIGTSKNLTYTFNIAGNYSIQHIVSNIYGTNSTAANLTFVNVSGPAGIPAANFSVDDNNVPAGTVVTFTDLSTNSPTSWLWQLQPEGNPLEWTNFSTDQNPTLTTAYINNLGIDPGVYNIRLTATNAAGSGSEIKYSFLTATEAPASPIASFTPTGDLEGSIYVIHINTNTTVYFNDTSTAGVPTSWNWSFSSLLGTSYNTSQHPSFEYNLTTATKEYPYTVTLVATNAAGSSSATKYIVMEDPPVTPIIRYDVSASGISFDVTHGTPDTQRISVYNGFDPAYNHNVTFDDKSYNSPTWWHWSIDAGNGSIYNYYTDNFIFDYGYANPGNYTVFHEARNDAGTDSLTMLTLVNVLDSVPPASISSITNVTGPTQIKWNWTIPADSDYSHAQVYKDGIIFANVTGNGTTWSGLTPSTEYTISTHAVDIYGNVNSTWVNLSSTTLGSTWEYTTCGVHYWPVPEGVTAITLKMIAGGGSGHPAYTSTGYYYGGWGGKAGEAATYPNVAVVPGTNYTLVVGCKGASATYGTSSNAGTLSSAFGTTVNGGAGGLPKVSGDTNTSVGGDGEDGLGITPLAINGTTTALGAGGIAGLGRGASGGGSAANTTAGPLGTGGAGADGYINITVLGYSNINIPDFVADPTSAKPNTLIRFTDLSTITDTAGLTYNWSFGDGGYSSTVGDTQHVYTYAGVYDVALTLTTANGTSTERKVEYISIFDTGNTFNTYTPWLVRIRITDAFGIPLPGAQISVNYIASSLPDTNASFLQKAFGVDQEVAQTMATSGLAMRSNTTDDGSTTFLMFPVISYGLTITNESAGLNNYRTLTPRDQDYLIRCPLADQHAANDTLTQVTTSRNLFYRLNSSYYNLSMIYSDASGRTTNLKFQVYDYSNGNVLVYDHNLGAPGVGTVVDNYTVYLPLGKEYRWGYNATKI